MFDEFIRHILERAPEALTGLTFFLSLWTAGYVTQRVVIAVGRKSKTNDSVFLLAGRTVYSIALIVGIVGGVGMAGVDVSALIAGLGLTGFALGFALRDALSNVLSGALILIYRPFGCGDRIAAAGFEGVVMRIDLRYTMLRGDRREILIPNANLFTHPVVILHPEEA